MDIFFLKKDREREDVHLGSPQPTGAQFLGNKELCKDVIDAISPRVYPEPEDPMLEEPESHFLALPGCFREIFARSI